MKIEVDIELLLEARDGLKAYGQSATQNTVDKLNKVILDAVGPDDDSRCFICGHLNHFDEPYENQP